MENINEEIKKIRTIIDNHLPEMITKIEADLKDLYSLPNPLKVSAVNFLPEKSDCLISSILEDIFIEVLKANK